MDMAQKPSKKRKKSTETPNVTALATRAGCSRTLVLRLLRRGLTEQQIVARIAENKRRKAELDLPTTPVAAVNGHAANGNLLTFTEAQTLKENHLAALRGLQVARAQGAVYPLQPLRAITLTVANFQRDVLWRWPGELAPELSMRSGDEIAEALRRHIESLFHASSALFEAECSKYNIKLPPELPPRPVPSKLPYFEQYVAGSKTGDREHIHGVKEIGTPEWMQAHPSVGVQESFQILARKRRWDADMAALLNRRSEWDLPPEPEPPEPEEPPEAA
jgi:hypothetical protein